jgi:DegV family protein with EDD domain
MSRVCILTDSTAQFPFPGYPGHELVTVIPLQVNLRGKLYTNGRDIKLGELPASAGRGLAPGVIPPGVIAPRVIPPESGDFRQVLAALGQNYTDIIVLLLSAHLIPAVQHAKEAAASINLPARVDILDSQTTSVGLGLLVQAAAEAARDGMPGAEILRMLRVLIPHVYTLFCVQSLSYLACAGKMDPAQALIGEMLGLIPFLTLENGQLTPLQKARSTRHLIDVLIEFLTEFNELKHVALLQGLPVMTGETRLIRERILETIPNTPFSEHTLGGALAALLGPRSLGLVVMERL